MQIQRGAKIEKEEDNWKEKERKKRAEEMSLSACNFEQQNLNKLLNGWGDNVQFS